MRCEVDGSNCSFEGMNEEVETEADKRNSSKQRIVVTLRED